MNLQSLATATLLLPAAVFGVIAFRALKAGRTTFGLRWRDGKIGKLLRGAGSGVLTAVAFVLVFAGTGLVIVDGYIGGWLEWSMIAVYFLLLFLLEEVAFRGVLLTGLGVVVGPVAAVLVSSVLVALPYSFSLQTSVLAVVGAVIANVVTGVARWRTGRIWFGLGWRWVLNVAVVGLGFSDAGFRLEHPLIAQHVAAPAWLSGGSFGPEAGVAGLMIELVVITLLVGRVGGRYGPWRVSPVRAGRSGALPRR